MLVWMFDLSLVRIKRRINIVFLKNKCNDRMNLLFSQKGGVIHLLCFALHCKVKRNDQIKFNFT